LDILFTKEAKKTLGTMNEKIQAVAESLDTLLAQRSQINKKNAGPSLMFKFYKLNRKSRNSAETSALDQPSDFD
jgi:hypothetical protein